MIKFPEFFSDIADTHLETFQNAIDQVLEQRVYHKKHGDWPNWYKAIDALPDIPPSSVSLNEAAIRIGDNTQLSDPDRARLSDELKHLHPWRKGPFSLFGIDIDTEWRSDMKWDRLKDHISSLDGRFVLDVGCGSGYHCWRMRGAGARFVLGIDPSLKFLLQFKVFKHYLPSAPVHYLPLRSEDLPPKMNAFDTVFSMGVLYHRKSPFEHLEELRDFIRPGGELVLETLVVDGDENTVLVPPDRYAMMPNVWCLPSPKALCRWLEKLGFENVKVINVDVTSSEEQRATPWMWFQSLEDFLSPSNKKLTAEGLPAPTRAIIIATKPV
jgi:tRNA (mo5U34)-methyltransferase